MTVREDIIQALRTWIKVGAVPPSGTPLTDAQVIPADDPAPRPPPPYLTVKLTNVGTGVMVDEDLWGTFEAIPVSMGGTGDERDHRTRGQRRATLSLQGFGTLSAEWIEEAALALRRPTVHAALTAAKLSVESIGGLIDLTELVDTEQEPRFLREFDVFYVLVTDPETGVELETVELDLTLEDREDDPDPLSFPVTVDLTVL